MRSFVLLFLLTFSLLGSDVLWAGTDNKSGEIKSSEVLIAAESAFMRGDLLGSNRFYTLAYEKTPQALDVKDIENLVVTKRILLPFDKFLAFCKDESQNGKFKVEAQFFCAKALIHDEKYIEAIDYVNNIPKSYQRLEYHFLKASLLLKINKTQQCLEEMNTAQTKVTDNTSLHFRDLIQVIHARCLLSEGRFADAVNKFQTLSVNSDFYLTTLEEQAWAHFKARNLTSSRDILKILISYFTGQEAENQIFGADVYFRAKYLQAYIELISQNRERSKEMFTTLKTEIQKFRKENLSKNLVPKDTMVKLAQLKTTSQLLNKNFTFVAKFRDFMNTWATVEGLKHFDNDLRYLIAINAEIETVQRLNSGDLAEYLKKLKGAQRLQAQAVYATMENHLRESKRNIDSIEFKANMGQVENFWAARTEGKRTLAEVLEAYKREVTHVEDYLGK